MIRMPPQHDDLHISHPECLACHLHDEQYYTLFIMQELGIMVYDTSKIQL